MSSTSSIKTTKDYFPSLDGWRGIAIICVILAHWFPLGPSSLKLNSLAGVLGMSIFFSLSGFLIANLLIKNDNVPNFLTRRFFRIIPLAYLYLLIVLPFMKAPLQAYIPNFLFYANLPPFYLYDEVNNSHFWSLGVEVQFYIAVALIVFFFKKRGLIILPFLAIFVTGLRILHAKEVSIETYFRVDEIIAGACLALIYNYKNHPLGKYGQSLFKIINPYILLPLLFLSSHDWGGYLNYARPYLAALLVGSTLYQDNTKLYNFLTNAKLKYIATISYALYVIHPIIATGWLDPKITSNKLITYLVQRPISLLILLGLAHLSTFYYEKYWMRLGKKLSQKET